MANEFETVRVIALEDEASGPEAGQYLLVDSASGTKKMQVENLLDAATLSDTVKEALLACFRNVAWINADGQDYYDALEAALNDEPEPGPAYDHTIEYAASDGIILSQADGFEVVGGTVGDMQQVISNGILNVKLPSSGTHYVMIRLANYTPASVSKARFACKYRFNTLSVSAEETGVALTMKADSACAGIYTHKPASGNSYFTIRDSQNSAVDTSKQLVTDRWYEVEGLIENGIQTIKIDGEQVYTGAGNTQFGSSGFVFTRNQANNGSLDVDIESAVFQWS